MEKERVIFRREYNPYRKEWGFLACFPDMSALPGNIGVTSFTPDSYGRWECWGGTEVSLDYYYSKKIIHKGTEEAEKCLEILKYFYPEDEEGYVYEVCEKIMH